ncbi:E3 ubiquitin-protein ligase RBBP6-like [Haliotis rufescens]|uniref:E3 ubiquitin-protein ligase RBBP6-like n=1 Tax=Haliotis rufescens TaxID=6454 RepID=UPI00201FAE61|nr:E3 ubiquitin-protein ligase RBBP6-like [Haliotis rufescens]
MSTVHYKFKSSLEYQSVTFDGIHISLGDLKRGISHQKRLKPGEYNLVITNAQTREVYKNDDELIPKNSSVIVSRIPVAATTTTNSTSKAWEQFKQDCAKAIQKEKAKEMMSLDQLRNTADLVNARATEMDKIKAAINQSTRDFDPSNYAKSKLPTGTPPNTYTCYKCGKPGHFIHACPLKDSETPGVIEPRFKRSTGIPNSFLTLTDDPTQPGALLTHTGHFAVPTLDATAYKIGKKERPPFLPEPKKEIVEPQQPRIPPALQCPLCKELLRDAVVTPCCGNSFCDECIRNGLLETDDHECPVCHETDVSPSQLIPNKFHRDAVSRFVNDSSHNQVKPERHPPSHHVQAPRHPPIGPPHIMTGPPPIGPPRIKTGPPRPIGPPHIQTGPPPPIGPPHIQTGPPPIRNIHTPLMPVSRTATPASNVAPVPQVPPPQTTVPPPTQPPPAMVPVEPRPPPQVSIVKSEPPDSTASGSLSPGEHPSTPTRDENSQSAASDEEPRGMAVQVVGTRIGNSIQLTGPDTSNEFDHGPNHRRGRHFDGRDDRDRKYSRHHDRPDHYSRKDNFQRGNFDHPPPRDPTAGPPGPPPHIPQVKNEPTPYPPFPGPPPSMAVPPPGFGLPPRIPPTGPPPAPIPVLGPSSGGFPPSVYPSGMPPSFPPPFKPLSEAEFYKEKARLLQQSLPVPAPRPRRDMMDDFTQELLAYSKDQRRRKVSRSKSRTKSKSRSRSRSRSIPRNVRRSHSRSRSKSWVRSRTRSRSRSRSRNRKLSRSRSRSPRRSRSRLRSRTRSRTRSPRRSRSRSRSPRLRSRSRSPRPRTRSRTRSPRYTRSRSRSRSRPRYRSYSRSRSRSYSRSPRYSRSRSRSPYRRRSPYYRRSRSTSRPRSPVRTSPRRLPPGRDRWSPPPFRNYRQPEAPPPPPGETGPPPLMGLPMRRFSPPPDRYGYNPYPDRGMPPDPYFNNFEPRPYDDQYNEFFRFGMGPPPGGVPNYEGVGFMGNMTRDPRAKSPRRRGRSPARGGRGRRNPRNPDFRRDRNPDFGNQEFENQDQLDFRKGSRSHEFNKRDENSQEGKSTDKRRDANRKLKDKGKRDEKKDKKDGRDTNKDNKENADGKAKRDSVRREKESGQKPADDRIKKMKKKSGKDGSDSDSTVAGQNSTKKSNLIEIKIEASIPEEPKKSSSRESSKSRKDAVPKKSEKNVKSDNEKSVGKKVDSSKTKVVKKVERPGSVKEKSEPEKPRKMKTEKAGTDNGNQSDNMPGKLRVKTKKKKVPKPSSGPESEGNGKSDGSTEKTMKKKRMTPDIPEDIPEEDIDSPAKRVKLEADVKDSWSDQQVLTQGKSGRDEETVPVVELSKWERDDYEEDSASPARKVKRGNEKKPLPKSIIESAEKVLSQKPMRPTSVASAVSAPVATKPHRRVYLEDEPKAADDDDRRVMNKQKSIEITISQAERGEKGDGRTKSDRRDREERRVDRKSSVSKLRADDERKGSRNSSTGSIKDRLGKREGTHYDKGSGDRDRRQLERTESREEDVGRGGKGTREVIRRDSRDSRGHGASQERSEYRTKDGGQDSQKDGKSEKGGKLVDRKESMIDEATFEPDYDEADTDSDNASSADDQRKNADDSGNDSSDDEDDDSSPTKKKNKDGEDKKHKKSKHKKHKHKHKHKHKKRKHKKHKEGKEKEK